jgi:hypothetical protein
VLSHESHELRGRPVDGQETRLNLEVLQHEFEEPAAAAGSLSRLVDVEVEDAHRIDLMSSQIKLFFQVIDRAVGRNQPI